MYPSRIHRLARRGLLWTALLVTAGTLALWAGQWAREAPPETRRDNVKEVIHGVEVVDPYRWLEDRKSPETQAWIEAQNAHTRLLLDRLPGRERLRKRITDLQRIDEIWSSRERNGRYFFEKRLASQEQFVIYMRQGLKGDDQVLIDPHPMSPDHTSYVSLMAASKDGTLIAYALLQRGENEATLHVFNVDTRRDLADLLPKGVYLSVPFKADNSGFYYTRQETAGSRVYYHPLGSDPAKDAELFGKGYGSDKIMFADLSEDGRYLLIHVWHGMAANETEIYFQDVVGRGPIQPVVNDLPARFFGAVGGNQLFMRTNWKAANGRVFAVDLQEAMLAKVRRKAVTAGSAQAKSADGSRVDSMVAHLRGLILYRQWMIDVHRRQWKKPIDLAEGDKEKQQVSAAVSFFETSFREGRQTAWLFLDWGNGLRALGKFDAAIEQYRRAGDIAPDFYAPSLNIAITLLEKSKIEAAKATVVDHFEAVRNASNYLTWIGGGGPYDNLVDKIADVLAVAGDGSEAKDFADCRRKHEPYEADRKLSDLSHTAALKLCVDQARDGLARRVVELK